MTMSQAIFDKVWRTMDECGLKMDTLLVKTDGTFFKHVFTKPEEKASIRSLSKPITCLCYGIAIDKGLFAKG